MVASVLAKIGIGRNPFNGRRILVGRDPIIFRLNPKKYRPKKFTPKVDVYQESGGFILKTISTGFEYQQALRLRHEVFFEELQNRSLMERIDKDSFDDNCDHLVIIEKASSRVVGTYRLNCSQFTKKFYSEGEFEISEFLRLPGVKLELGRACTHKDFRTGSVISLLWRGISEYANKTQADYLFGCASVQTEEPESIVAINEHLSKEGLLRQELGIKPLHSADYQGIAPRQDIAADQLIPGLVQSYLKVGAKFYGKPTHDPDFQCHDYFMILNLNEMNPAYRRRFGLIDRTKTNV